MSERRKQADSAVELRDLVYAPLGAVADANIRLSSNIVDFLASTGDLNTDSSGRPVVRLRTLQMMYEQLGSDVLDNAVTDSIGLEIPLLSIYPLSSLKVSKTKVSFGAEIRSMTETKDGLKVFTQASSANQRDGSVQACISYEVEMDSVPISEGLARFVDILNTQAIPRRIHSNPVDSSGRRLTGRELELYNKMIELRERENQLTLRLNEMRELTRIENGRLEMEAGMNFDEYREHLEHLRNSTDEDVTPLEPFVLIEEYMAISSEIETQIADVRRDIVALKAPQAEE